MTISKTLFKLITCSHIWSLYSHNNNNSISCLYNVKSDLELLVDRRLVFVDFIAQEDQDVITKAFEEYHLKTCVRFRPYKEGDEDFIKIEGKQSGCWSYVGHHGGGQVVNLQNPGCVHHGIIVHEMLHALGFYHQQSAYERDDFVRINWENIKLGKKMRNRIYS